MTLRARLTAAFLLVVLLPVLVGALLVGRLVPQLQRNVISQRLDAAGNSVVLDVRQTCGTSHSAAEATGALLSVGASRTAAAHTVLTRGLADTVVVIDARGVVRAVAGKVPSGVTVGSPVPPLSDCQQGQSDSRMLGSSVSLTSRARAPAGEVWAGMSLDDKLIRSWMLTGTNLTLVSAGSVLQSTLSAGPARRVATSKDAHLPPLDGYGPRVLQHVRRGDGQPLDLIVSTAGYSSARLYGVLGLVVLLALAICLLISWRLSRAVTSPLREVRDAARRVAEGDLATRIPIRSKDEIGQLASSFNTMTSELSAYVEALRASRDQLRGNLNLLGDTLSSTHDLNRILGVVLDTAMSTTSAQAGAIYLTAMDDVYCKVSRGLPDLEVDGSYRPGRAPAAGARRPRIHFGDGVIGRIVVSGEGRRGRIGPDSPPPAPGEPDAGTWIAVPFTSSGRRLGVLALYDRVGTDEFDDADLLTIRTFASQAAVAVDNVKTHQEAQRLSMTDELTGLRNYRSFQQGLAIEIERSMRFNRSMALLMLDLDHFKDVNDVHGHPYGDAVLAEVARRIGTTIREVDVFARYGGEELALLLPETDLAGAERLAGRICQMVRETTFGRERVTITVSVGVAMYPVHGSSAATLVERADAALYDAKSAGRNTWRTAEAAEG